MTSATAAAFPAVRRRGKSYAALSLMSRTTEKPNA
jgi:hypothetical protein